jgi:hypothetical protein
MRSYLLWEVHASQQVREAGVGAQGIDPQVSSEEVSQVGRFFLIGSLQKLESLVLLIQSCIDGRYHIRRDVGDFRLLQQFRNCLLCFRPLSDGCGGVCQSRNSIQVMVRQLHRSLILEA